MTRAKALQEISVKYPYVKHAAKLSPVEVCTMIKFIEDWDHLGHLEFEYLVNRMFLGVKNPNIKPKNWPIIQDLLTSANSRVFGRIAK